MITIILGSKMNSPFKFLEAYERKDKEIFFGRGKEIELLYNTTFKTNLCLVYGKTGTGKTSLIQCGLANRFRQTDWFDLYIRRRGDINTSLRREIRKKAETPIEEDATIVESIRSLYLDFLRPIYLIFDQFEELFTLGSKEEQQEFFKPVAELLESKTSCKIIFVMREEYIAWLYDFEKVVPSLFDNRIRIEPMQMSNVEEVIRGSASAFGIELFQPDETVKTIVINNKDKKGEIQLPFLQVYLDRLYREAANTAVVQEDMSAGEEVRIRFTPALVERIGKMSDVMAAFLDEQTSQIEGNLIKKYPHVPVESVWQILNEFVSLEGTNLPLEKETLYAKLPLNQDEVDFCLTELEKARILRQTDKDKTYEITHDTLAQRIDENRSVEEKTLLKVEKLVKDRFAAYEDTRALLTKGDLGYIEHYEDKLKSKLNAEEISFIVKSKKKVSRRKTIITAWAAAFSLIILVASFAFLQWNRAEKHFRNEKANSFTTLAQLQEEEDPTIALRLAEKSFRLNRKNKNVLNTIQKIYRDNNFYKILVREGKHITSIASAALSRDGNSIIIGSEDGTIHLWDLQEEKWRPFPGHHKDRVTCAVFSPDGKFILTGSWDKTARLWDVQGKEKQVFARKIGYVHAVALSPDGKYILTGHGDNTAGLWNMEGEEIHTFADHDGIVYSVDFSPEREHILTATDAGTVYLWNVQGRKLWDINKKIGPIYSAVFSPHGNDILTGSGDKTARLWDLRGNVKKVFRGHNKALYSVAFSPDGAAILTGSWDETARLWDLQGKELQVFKGHKGAVNFVTFSQKGKYIFTGSQDKTIRMWEPTGFRFLVLAGHEADVNSAAFSADGKYILTGSWDNTVRLWDVQGNQLRVLKGHESFVHSTTFSPDNKYILTGSWDKTVRLWDLEGKELGVLKGHESNIHLVTFSPDGKSIIAGFEDGTVALMDLQGNKIQTFIGHKEKINSAAFSPDGQYIFTGSDDKTARLWTWQGKQLKVFKAKGGVILSVFFSPDSQYILTASDDGTLALWNLKGEKLQDFQGHESIVNCAAFLPEKNYILTGSWDKTARLWDMQGNQLQVFRGHKEAIYAVAISPDGKYILTASADKTARLWEIKRPLEDFLENGLCERLSEEQKREFGINN